MKWIRGDRGRRLAGTALAVMLAAGLPVVGSVPRAVAVEVETGQYKELDPELLFEQGMASRKAGRIYSSIEAFSAILEKYPDLQRARLELAVSYYKAMNYDGALAEAQKVLEQDGVPSSVRVAILAFIAEVKSAREKNVMKSDWQFPLMVGYMYDTNVTAGPASKNFGTLTLTDDSVQESDSAFLVNVGVDHTLSTGKTFRVGEQSANLVWKSMANVFHRQYFKETDYNMTVMTLMSGPSLLSTGHWRSGVDLQFDAITYGNKELAQFFSATPYFTWTFGSGLELTGDVLVAHHSYKQSVDRGRTSDYTLPRIGFAYSALGSKLLFLGHVGYFEEDAKAANKTNEGATLYGAVSWNAAENTHLFASVRFWEYDYDGVEPYFSKARNDDERRYSAGVTHTFKNAGALTDWFVTAYYTYTDYSSNIPIYEFDRNQYNLTLNRRF